MYWCFFWLTQNLAIGLVALMGFWLTQNLPHRQFWPSLVELAWGLAVPLLPAGLWGTAVPRRPSAKPPPHQTPTPTPITPQLLLSGPGASTRGAYTQVFSPRRGHPRGSRTQAQCRGHPGKGATRRHTLPGLQLVFLL